MEVLLGLLLFLGVYSYTVYPGLLFIISKFADRPWARSDHCPSLSVIISAHNEEAVIAEKVRNTLNMDYPPHLLEVVVASDASTDGTDDIVRGLADARVKLVAVPGRVGKTECLNRAVPQTRGDILIFTDANAMFPPALAMNVARNFGAEEVGLVTGWTQYLNGGRASASARLYATLEHHIKTWESRIASCVGADGAICAMRRSLFQPLEPRDINDFVLPLHVVRRGMRAVLDPGVACTEERSEDERKEFRRQLRITAQALGALRRNLDLLNPFRAGVFALFLFSHKVLRFLAPFALGGALLVNLAVVGRAPVYAVLLGAQLLWLAMGFVGIAGWRGSLPVRLSALILITLCAQSVAWFRMFAGATDTVWTPQR